MGYSSGVYMKIMPNDPLMPALPIKENTVDIMSAVVPTVNIKGLEV